MKLAVNSKNFEINAFEIFFFDQLIKVNLIFTYFVIALCVILSV